MIVNQDGMYKFQPLGIAAKQGHAELVSKLIAAEVDVNFRDSKVRCLLALSFG